MFDETMYAAKQEANQREKMIIIITKESKENNILFCCCYYILIYLPHSAAHVANAREWKNSFLK